MNGVMETLGRQAWCRLNSLENENNWIRDWWTLIVLIWKLDLMCPNWPITLLYECYIQLSTFGLPFYKMLLTIYTCTNVRQNRLEQAMQAITNTQKVVVRPTLWHPCDDWRWRTNAKLGCPWWYSCIQLWHPAESKLLPLLHLGTLIWLLFPTHLITYTSSSSVQLDQQHTDA